MKEGRGHTKFGDICCSELGKTLNHSTDTGNLRPYLCSINIQWDSIDMSCVKEARFEDDEESRYSVKKGDLLICEGGDIGRSAIWEEDTPMLYQNALHRVRFKDGFNARYYMYYLRFLKNTGELDSKYGKGVTIKHLVKSSLLSIPVPTPAMSEQERIVAELDLLSGIIDKQKAQLKELDKLAQSIFYETFGGILNSAPKSVLKDIATYCVGLTYKPTDVSENGIIVLRSSNIQENKLDFKDTVRVNLNVSDKKLVHNGDILMCARNGSARLVGKVARIKEATEPMAYGAFMTTICSKYNDFLFYFFLSPYFRSQLTTSKTATVNQITSNMLDGIKLNVPSLELQRAFASKVESLESQKITIEHSIDETQKLFDFTMDNYFG